ncbi:MAG: dihydropteroate synthase [Flavobacteriales bacterium]
MIKNRFTPFTLNLRGQLKTFDHPLVMGILNLTPDSFYTLSRLNEETIIERAGQMIAEGVDILDIGGQSTRPGAERISAEEERMRIEPAVRAIRSAFPEVIISIDTFYGSVAQRALELGADLINDVSAGSLDPEIIEVAAMAGCPYVLMHMQGEPQMMQHNPQYTHVVNDIIYFFSEKIKLLRSKGIHDIVLDPGFGFGKTAEHNFELLAATHDLKLFNLPVLIGVSRKKMIQRAISGTAEEALSGTIAANTIALLEGASILRVHDVKPAVDARSIVLNTQKEKGS